MKITDIIETNMCQFAARNGGKILGFAGIAWMTTICPPKAAAIYAAGTIVIKEALKYFAVNDLSIHILGQTAAGMCVAQKIGGYKDMSIKKAIPLTLGWVGLSLVSALAFGLPSEET